MPWRARHTPGGLIYHMLNRRVGRQTLLHFPIKSDMHLLLVLRYVERNALRVKLVDRAENWPWYSLWRLQQNRGLSILSDWPVERPADWVEYVNEPDAPEELKSVRKRANRGCPFGDDEWRKGIAHAPGLDQTLRPRGRPKTVTAEEVE